jgi:DNA-binding PadR family transcriptional regulator
VTQPLLPFATNAEHLERVSSRIGRAILEFLRGRMATKHVEFHAEELRKHVDDAVGWTAPGSADRILRDLRSKGVLDYKVVNRRDSLYRVLSVTERP